MDPTASFAAYMADVSRHIDGFLDHAIGLDDIADYQYADAFTDGVPARECALLAIQNDDIASAYRYKSLPVSQVDRFEQRTQRNNGTTDTTDNQKTGKESSLLDRSFSDILQEHRPSVRHFAGNLSAPDEYITDGRILLLAEHIRTPGRVKKYQDKLPNLADRYPRTVQADAIDKVIPDYTNYAPASYIGCAIREGGTSLVFKVGDTRQYLCLDADLFAIVADVYAPVPVPEVLVHPDHSTTGPAIYLPYWYRRNIYGLIMPVRHRIEHPQLSN